MKELIVAWPTTVSTPENVKDAAARNELIFMREVKLSKSLANVKDILRAP